MLRLESTADVRQVQGARRDGDFHSENDLRNVFKYAIFSTALLFLLLRSFAADAATSTSTFPDKQVKVVVITTEHLSWYQLSRTNLPNLCRVRDGGAIGLVSPGLARYPDPASNQWATFTAGDVVNAKNPHIGLLQRQLLANGVEGEVKIVRFGDVSAPGKLAQLDTMIGTFLSGQSVLFVCTIVPPQLTTGSWDELTPIALYPNQGSTLTSSTTRTVGLVALRDLAPTVLRLVGAPIPQSMTGAPIEAVAMDGRIAKLDRMFRITQLGQETIVPLSWFLGLSALCAVVGGAVAVAGGQNFNGGVVRYLLRLVLAAPLALLAAPCFPVSSVPEYMSALVLFDAIGALALKPAWIMAITSTVILVDALTGSHLIAATVVSGFWLSGIRFYGIGNEYMGVLIAMALLTPVTFFKSTQTAAMTTSKAVLTGIYFAVVVLILSYPGFGAKAGGAVTSVVTFSLAWFAVFRHVRPSIWSFLAASICGFGLIFALTLAAKSMHAPPSHIESAVSAVHHGRLGYIKHIALRKAKMAIKTVLTPGGIVAIFGLVLLWIYWRRSALKGRVEAFLASRQILADTLRSGGWGLAASLLFNDSGGVAFLFYFCTMALFVLHEMVRTICDSSHSISVTSG